MPSSTELFDQADTDINVLNSYYSMGHDGIFTSHILTLQFPDQRSSQKQSFNADCLSYCQQALADGHF
jgi:hypothetical protein